MKTAVSKRKTKVLITTVVKEGVDFPISPVIAINASGKKSFVTVVQFLGRIVRRNEEFGSFRCYLDFIDTAHPMLLKHSEERVQHCRDTGSDVVVCESIADVVREIVKHYNQIKP